VAELEQKIKDFAKKAGAGLVGIAGPGRFDGPPSLDPTFEMPGGKSIISLVLPFSVGAIYEFFGKVSPTPHNIDQTKTNQRMNRISKEIADYIVSLGYKAKPVLANNTYRRCLDPFAIRPSFSHRMGAVVAGLGTFGLSGNVVTKEYGAATVLGTVITNAKLESDPQLPPRYAMDNRCKTCKLCDKSCTMGMFRDDDEEYLLINGELHARGKRDNIDFCNAPCFGLHAISRDKKWTNWGQHWIKEWTDSQPDPNDRVGVRQTFMRVGARSGDSTLRFKTIVRTAHELHPRGLVEDLLPDYESLPKDENERIKILLKAFENMGSFGLERDPNLITCTQCVLVCGPDFEETKKRYDLLCSSGYVVPDADWKMHHYDTYEEAVKHRYVRRVPRAEMMKDATENGKLWFNNYFGIEPKGEIQDFFYQIKAKNACAKAGLKGKEARAPIIINPAYLMAMMMPQKKMGNGRPAPEKITR
jgi:hypothetical protein